MKLVKSVVKCTDELGMSRSFVTRALKTGRKINGRYKIERIENE